MLLIFCGVEPINKHLEFWQKSFGHFNAKSIKGYCTRLKYGCETLNTKLYPGHLASSQCRGASWQPGGFRCCCRHSGWGTRHCPRGPTVWREARGNASCWDQVGILLCLTSPDSGTALDSAPETGICCGGGEQHRWSQSTWVTVTLLMPGSPWVSLPFHTPTYIVWGSLLFFYYFLQKILSAFVLRRRVRNNCD